MKYPTCCLKLGKSVQLHCRIHEILKCPESHLDNPTKEEGEVQNFKRIIQAKLCTNETKTTFLMMGYEFLDKQRRRIKIKVNNNQLNTSLPSKSLAGGAHQTAK